MYAVKDFAIFPEHFARGLAQPLPKTDWMEKSSKEVQEYGRQVDKLDSPNEVEMTPREEIKHRAFMMGIASGDMPNVDLIWSLQKVEGFQDCFGQGLHCKTKHCKWRSRCIALDFYADTPLPIARAAASPGVRRAEAVPARIVPFASRRPAAQNLRRRAAYNENEKENVNPSASAGAQPMTVSES